MIDDNRIIGQGKCVSYFIDQLEIKYGKKESIKKLY